MRSTYPLVCIKRIGASDCVDSDLVCNFASECHNHMRAGVIPGLLPFALHDSNLLCCDDAKLNWTCALIEEISVQLSSHISVQKILPVGFAVC